MTKEIQTKNRHGAMFPLAKYTQAFVDYAKKHGGTYLDIGAAYGVTTIPALEGGAKVIANDLSVEQLAILQENTPEHLRANLTLLPGRFPEFDLPEQSLDGIVASHVLHFLEPMVFRSAIKILYRWLKPGGKIFVQNFTPYHKFMASFIPQYHQNIARGEAFPGYTEHSENYVLLQDYLPSKINLLDPTVMAREFIAAGFQVESVEFTPCPPGLSEEFFPLDGREWVGFRGQRSDDR
jgi:SAM-dependent methyltransferase